MHFSKLALTAASVALFAVARADDLDLDNDDIPTQCRSLCDPVKRLADICEVDDDDRMTDREEDLLQAQCFCLNASFDVSGRTAACAACMHQNNTDRDDNEDIDDIMRTCGFASTTFDAAAQVTSVDVQATRPVSAAEITTTIEGAVNTGANSAAQPTTTGTNTNNNNNNNNNNNSGGSNSDSSNTNGTPSETPNAAAGNVPIGGFSGVVGVGAYVAAAAVAGAMLLQ